MVRMGGMVKWFFLRLWDPIVSYLKKKVLHLLKEKTKGASGVVSEMMKESGGFVRRWMIDRQSF